ncbi:hypothetical protein BOTBODRAFT_112838 [Botryobasidium botryosum FD-172 SS1]|uniref:Uncharacterized protein n=1 Tax=Botryobasidium botryosum (strain FD-172 SS1) TaxID=930990 RepID=A0A067MCS1_BOTB1|nr:hypothetical protein BOTBODRAFT_112838 [Botryobasidium botryosum FD-172 SS1]
MSPSHTFTNGFRQVITKPQIITSDPEEQPSFVHPDPVHVPTSTKGNEFGVLTTPTYPTLLFGTNAPQGPPEWFKKESEVDVLICGAGPSGLEVAISLLRQGVSFRIIDKSAGPLLSGRADGVQPRFMETVAQWGLGTEIAEEGPLIERTAIWKDGKNLIFGNSHFSDSRYRGLHIITQSAIETVFIRDLMRHKKVVERLTSVKQFTIDESPDVTHPVAITLANQVTGETELVRAKFLIGSDGGSSTIRKQMGIKFEGVSTDIHWGIMDAVFETTYPHAGVFGCVINSRWGGCAIIPRENGMIRLYTQIDPKRVVGVGPEEGGAMDMGTITPEEVLAQANRIFAPFTLKFASPLSWFAIWKISERVAERYSLKNRVHLTGDASHVHSVLGAFGLNASILDSANLAWKIGMCSRGLAKVDSLMPTYESERRRHAVRIIEVSGTYLRFMCNSDLGVVKLSGVGTEPREDDDDSDSTAKLDLSEGDAAYLQKFFAKNGAFLLGVDIPYSHSALNPRRIQAKVDNVHELPLPVSDIRATEVKWGVRAPNPRVTLGRAKTAYLYDTLAGPDKFSVVVFASDLAGPVRAQLKSLDSYLTSSSSFYTRFGAEKVFKFILVTTHLPDEAEAEIAKADDLPFLREHATLVFDDHLIPHDAHTTYGVSHAKGAVAIVRPDLWLGVSVLPGEGPALDEYFGRFLVPAV